MHTIVLSAGVVLAGCTAPGDDVEYSSVESYATVGSYVSSSCSTASVLGLSKQIADEISCANPTGLTRFTAGGNLQVTSNAVLPYLSAKGKTDLMTVASGRVVQVNSAFRTVAQQYLLYQWYLQGRCGIPIAATPGRSNHESGRAVDLANYSALITPMSNRGWAHDVPGDAVHFDHLASPDIRGRDVLAFQKLWNRNHPGDTIAEDGAYGPNTEARLRQAPSEGFAIGPTCTTMGTRVADVVSVMGPDRVPPKQLVHYAVTIKNAGTVAWPATTKLRLKDGSSSPLYDTSWTSQTVITTLGAEIAAGKSGAVDFDVMTPDTNEELPVFEELELDDGGTKFGTIELALTVAPGVDPAGESSEGDDLGDDIDGGCNAGGGGAGGGMLAMVMFVGLRRRRR
jgi:uncharacterized protein (TIGR03382 family)